MGELKESLQQQIDYVSEKFLEKSKNKEIQVVSHFDTDGICSAVIMTKVLKRLDKKFSLKIVKSLDEKTIKNLSKNKITLFLDLASGSFHHIIEHDIKDVFIIDHHEIVDKIPNEVEIVNPELHEKQKISSSSLVYLFCKTIDEKNKDLAKFAVLGMVGDMLEKEIDKVNNHILEDAEIKRKRGLLIYPSTRPLNRVLEYCSQPLIPGVTGSTEGVIELLREAGLSPENGKYKSIIDLDKTEMEKLITAIMLRNPKCKTSEIVGDIFLIKLFNKLEDAREISAMINACSRIGESTAALQFLMEIPSARKKAETLHIKYKQHLISAIKSLPKIEKIEGRKFLIINAQKSMKDTIVGTIASILQHSSLYEDGTIIITMAHYDDKIKVSARIVGRNGRNAREILAAVVEKIGGEVGGHESAAGCNISQKKEAEFIELLKKNLEVELVKV
ncbi:MAG: DHH family phosphoesterase [Nanoarchaeota archaeon]